MKKINELSPEEKEKAREDNRLKQQRNRYKYQDYKNFKQREYNQTKRKEADKQDAQAIIEVARHIIKRNAKINNKTK